MAEAGAAKWDVDMSAWTLVEQDSHTAESGRADHTLQYELRSGLTVDISPARHRLLLKVAGTTAPHRWQRSVRGSHRQHVAGGDLTTVRRYIKVPDTFMRRFQHLRSGNESIAAISTVCTAIFCACGAVGLFYASRRSSVNWSAAVAVGATVTVVRCLADVNSWPNRWWLYDTATSLAAFRMQQLVGVLSPAAPVCAFAVMLFAAGEVMTRISFPRQVQVLAHTGFMP